MFWIPGTIMMLMFVWCIFFAPTSESHRFLGFAIQEIFIFVIAVGAIIYYIEKALRKR